MALPRFYRKVARGDPPGTLTIKDLAVLIPLFASTLAISWEVGRFLPIGAFRFFSLSEHLLAAMEALPVAFAFCACFAYFAGTEIRGERRQVRPRPNRPPLHSLVRNIEKVFFIVVFSAIYFYATWIALRSFDVLEYVTFSNSVIVIGFTIAGVPAFFVILWLNLYWLRQPWSGPLILCMFAGLGIFTALTTGIGSTLFTLNKTAKQESRLATLTIKGEGTTKAFIIMVGERGLLIYSPDTDRFSIQKSDAIQKIEWQPQ